MLVFPFGHRIWLSPRLDRHAFSPFSEPTGIIMVNINVWPLIHTEKIPLLAISTFFPHSKVCHVFYCFMLVYYYMHHLIPLGIYSTIDVSATCCRKCQFHCHIFIRRRKGTNDTCIGKTMTYAPQCVFWYQRLVYK